MNPQLLAQTGPLSGQRLELAAPVVTLGREAGNTVVVPDQTVSRNHARISVVNGAATIEDAGSSGGTFVNELRISGPTVLKVGDVVRLGGSSFTFTPGTSVSPMGLTATMPSRAGRRREVGSAEQAQVPMPTSAPAPVTGNSGCMPDFSQFGRDLEGCMPLLLRMLIIFLIIVAVVAVIGGIVFLVGIAASGVSVAPGVSGGGSGTTTGGGSPQPSSQPQQQPPPQQQQQQQQPTHAANGAIRIVKVRTAYLAREGYMAPVPVALIDWQNVGSESVVEVFADVTSYDKDGKVIGLQKAVRIYTGAAVPPNGSHSDNDKTDGVILSLDQGKGQALDHAAVTPTEIRVEQASNPEE